MFFDPGRGGVKMSVAVTKKSAIRQRFLVVVIILAAAVVRIATLPSVGCLSFDEAWSVWIARKSFGSAFEIVLNDKHPPLFYGLLYVWVRVAGISEFSLRMLSVVAGVVGVAALYRVGRELFGHATGAIAAFVLAVAPFQIWYSQEARMYPLALAFSLLSVLFLWKARARNRPKYWAGYVFFTLTLMFTHYMAGLILLGQGLFLLVEAFRDRERVPVLRRWLLSLFAMCLVGLPWLPRLISQVRIDSGPPPWIAELYGPPTLKELYHIFFQHYLLWNPQFYPRWLRWTMYFVCTMLVILAVFEGRSRFPFFRVTSHRAVALCSLCLLPIGAVWLLSQVWPMYVPRYFLAFSGYFYLLLAWGMGRVPVRWVRVLVAVLVVATLVWGSARLPDWQRERDWEAIADYVLAHWEEGDVAVITPLANWIVFDYYTAYGIPHDLEFYRRLYPSYPEPPSEEELRSTLLDQRFPCRRLWWIDERDTGLAAEWDADPDQTVRRFLDQHFSLEEVPGELTSRWGNVLLYRLAVPDDTGPRSGED